MARSGDLKRRDIVVTFRLLPGILLLGGALAMADPPDRVTRPVDPGRISNVPGHLHHLARPQLDLGSANPEMQLNYMVLLVKPSAAQQADLDQMLADQQNPSSPHFREWFTPEDFANRFGLSSGDQSKVVSWLASAGFTVNHLARGRNWIAFTGTAAQVEAALHTPVHRFQVGSETHFANISEPAVPEALADIVGGFLGLNDFLLNSFAMPVQPDYNSGGSHYLAPQDFATIYDVGPLYSAGIDGTGQSIAIVGQSDVSLSDIRAFRSRYNLPANDPKMLPYSSDPGFNSSQLEGNLDLEWAGAIAPNATIYYIYGTSAITAMVAAIELNVAPVVSISYGGCEIEFAPSAYRAIGQQGNAQGITILAASGDSGAAGCDSQSAEPFATRGLAVYFPAAMPEVTAVGGTQFTEGSGTYWAATNSSNFGSALSYIPEAAWNESSSSGLGSSGGGASLLYPQPFWQTGAVVPADTFRHVPDVAFSAASHDAYYVNYLGSNIPVAGTSASAPAMAGIVALLNHYQLSKGFQKRSGLGNINPQLYRLAQSTPSAFHDVAAGNNIVPCAQGSPDCTTGSFGYSSGPGYDSATGLGSMDANVLIAQWNTAVSGVLVTLSANAASGTINDSVQVTATVVPVSGGGTPTGTVSFVFDTLPFGIVALTGGSASLTLPLYRFAGTGTATIGAQYSGDSSFASGGATKSIKITLPTGAAAIIVSAPNTVWPSPPDAQGLSWQANISLIEVAGVAATITGFTVDGQTQTLSQYFPSPAIRPGSTISTSLIYRNLTTPLTRTFGFTGIDALGNVWSRQVVVNYLPLPADNFFSLSATPLTVTQNLGADPSCQWPVQLNVDDLGGFGVNLITSLSTGGVSLTNQIASIFGTPRLDAWGDLQGTLCFGGITPPATESIDVGLSDGASFNLVVSFAGPPANPVKLSATPASLSLATSPAQPAQATLAINLSDPAQTWTASIFPANRTTAWLNASQLSGAGASQITLTASGAGFEPGVYRATIVIQSTNANPQFVNVPVMFVLSDGGSAGTKITRIGNAASDFAAASPGMLLNVYGSNLANTTQAASGNPLPYTTAGVTAAVNGLAAPVLYASPGMLTIQVPYSAGAGPAVLGVNNNGSVAGFGFQVSPSSPGIYADAGGNLLPSATAQQGGFATLFVTGTGEVSPALKTAYSPAPTPVLSSLPVAVLPLSVTIGGVEAFVQFAGIPPGLIGTMQVNVIVPMSVPIGTQSVVVTAGGAPSPPVSLTIEAASGASPPSQ